MILRLTASCNNRCFFCMVDDEIAASNFRSTESLISELDSADPNETVDIFGGEPTIDPSFWAVLEHAVSTGRYVTLASNARLFSHRPSAEQFARIAMGRSEVRTSLMGDTAELHDRLNVARKAFVQTIRGIENLTDLGVSVPTNIVILEENIERLLETALVAVSAGSQHIKFSGFIRSFKFKDSIPDPLKIRTRIESIIPTLRAIGIDTTLEKLPLCVARSHVEKTQPEDGWRKDPNFRHTQRCNACAMKAGCSGGEIGAIDKYGDDWMVPFDTVPDYCTDEVNWIHVDSYLPGNTTRFVRVLYDDMDIDDLVIVGQSVHKLKQRHPSLTVV